MPTTQPRRPARVRNDVIILAIEDNADQQQLIRWAADSILKKAKLVVADGSEQALTYLNRCVADGFGFPQWSCSVLPPTPTTSRHLISGGSTRILPSR